MKPILAICRVAFATSLILSASLVMAQDSPADTYYMRHVMPGVRVFIDKMNGFDDYLMAALHTKQVPVVIVTDKAKADFIISGYAFGSNSNRTNKGVEATIKAVNRDGEVVFAYSYDESYAIHGQQSAAEACAKGLKKEITGRY